jgi:plastocyanin
MTSNTTLLGAAAAALIAAAACGGGSSNSGGGGGTPTAPTPTPTTATITITASGVSPRTVTISAGSRVTFVNNDTRAHDMASDPHPSHTACPEINDVGFLQPGQSRTTGNLNTARTCGFHDHNRDTDTSLQGSIVIQ